jgi:hypothetical protein
MVNDESFKKQGVKFTKMEINAEAAEINLSNLAISTENFCELCVKNKSKSDLKPNHHLTTYNQLAIGNGQKLVARS